MAAQVTFATTLARLDNTQATQIVRGGVSLTGNYPGTAGDPMSFVGPKSSVQSNKPAVIVFFTEKPSASVYPSGYQFYYQQGTTAANGTLRITSPAGTELAAAAYPAALLQANIQFEAIFTLGI